MSEAATSESTGIHVDMHALLRESWTLFARQPLVHALVEGHRFSAAEIEDFRRLLDEHESQKRQSKGKKR